MVNITDVTLTLARLPLSEWIAIDPASRATSDGTSVGLVDTYDTAGRIGQATMIGLADIRNLADK